MLDHFVSKRIIPIWLLLSFFLTIILKDSQLFILSMYALGLFSYIFFVSGQIRSLVSVFMLFWLFREVFQHEVNQIFDPVLVSSSALLFLGIKNLNRRVINSLSAHRKVTIYLLLFNCLMSVLYFAKSLIVPEYTATVQTTGKEILFSLALVIIITKMESENFTEFIDYMVLLVTVSLSLQAIFADQLNQSGFTAYIVKGRTSGLFVIDQNEFSRILAVCSSYMVMRILQLKDLLNRFTIVAILGFIGILVTGSRTGFVVFVIVSFFAMIFNWNFDLKKTVILSLVTLLGVVMFSEFGSNVSERLVGTNMDVESRPLYFAAYLSEILQDPTILIAGASKKMIFRNVFDQSSHNVYLQITYDFGLIVLLLFLSFFVRLFYLSLKHKFVPNYSFPIMIYLLISLSIGDYRLFYLPIVIALSKGMLNSGMRSGKIDDKKLK